MILEDPRRPNRRVLVTHGYGNDLNSPLGPYLERNARFILGHGVHNWVPCGGVSQGRSFPGQAEARTMSGRIRELLPPDYPLVVHHETESLTTYRNVRGAARIIRFLQHRLWAGDLPRPGELTVYCEAQRVFKVIVLYWLMLPDFRPGPDGLRIRFETDSWERANPLKEIPKLGNELLMHFLPPWERYMHNKRIALAELR